jgi:hypothetical protein
VAARLPRKSTCPPAFSAAYWKRFFFPKSAVGKGTYAASFYACRAATALYHFPRHRVLFNGKGPDFPRRNGGRTDCPEEGIQPAVFFLNSELSCVLRSWV